MMSPVHVTVVPRLRPPPKDAPPQVSFARQAGRIAEPRLPSGQSDALAKAEDTVALVQEVAFELCDRAADFLELGLEVVVDALGQIRMVADFFEDLCRRFTEGVPDVVVEGFDL
ncbi:hypothetical protein [Seohaeicola sp. 4SK31]|uniref:hypothetical protein n=1 Tax=Seohaeicola sp. 4SK31 TaxID=3028386 RepID=UPI00237BE637|nr:hypothetical protein [Seohaeicola sp. 4SK31]MDD9709036.1 hypothetical protein [Seohaeicola sp. 4SK31]